MFKKFSYILYKLIKLIDLIFIKILKKSFFSWFKEFIEDDSYKTIVIKEKNIKFFIPNNLTEYRVDTFFIKEPETLEWIDNFITKENIIFWDIGANIGLYSIYAAVKNEKIKVYSFEPSTSNLRVLSRNVSLNQLENKIYINQFPLSNKENGFELMMESNFIEGGALHSFGVKKDFEGKDIKSKNNYRLYGFNINFLINNLNFEIPDYIKIDVDGLEHFILEGANKILSNNKIKGILVEINENYLEQAEKVKFLMDKFKFNLIKKEQSKFIKYSKKFEKSYNYIFER